MNFIEWHDGSFVPAKSQPVPYLPPLPDAVTWWHASTQLTGTQIQSIPGVTHLGDQASAQHRADVQALARLTVTGLHEIQLPAGMSVLPEVYLENQGQEEMKEFEKTLLNSKYDVAFTWNQKEADGAWSIIVRRSVIGQVSHALGKGVTLESTKKWKPGQLYDRLAPLMPGLDVPSSE